MSSLKLCCSVFFSYIKENKENNEIKEKEIIDGPPSKQGTFDIHNQDIVVNNPLDEESDTE